MSKQFIKLTDIGGDPVILPVAKIVQIIFAPISFSHKEFDPDCLCSDCKNWWSSSSVLLDILCMCNEHESIQRMEVEVREDIDSIYSMLP